MIFYIVKMKAGAPFIDYIRTGPDTIVVPLNDNGDQCDLDKFVEGTYQVDLHIFAGGKPRDYTRDFVVSYKYPYAMWLIDDMQIPQPVVTQK